MITWLAVMLALYVVAGTIIASKYRGRAASSADYFVAGYSLSGVLTALTYAATTYSAFMMLGLVGLAYATGVGALGFELSYYIATLLLLALLAPMIWREARRRGWVSASEMLSDLYGTRLIGVTATLVYLVALTPYVAAQIKGIGDLLDYAGMNYLAGILVASVLVLAWIGFSGMWSVAATDAFQGLWMITAAILFLAWIFYGLLPGKGLGMEEAFSMLGDKGFLGATGFWRPVVFVSFTLPWLFFAVTNPQVVQRLYVASDEKALRRAVRYFALYGFLYTIIVVLVGLAARSLVIAGSLEPVGNRDRVTPVLLGFANPLFAAFVYTSIIAAAVSTANSIVLSVTSSFVRDFYEASGRRRFSRHVSLAVTVFLIASAAIIAYYRVAFIVELSVMSSVMLLPMAPITLAGILLPERARRSGAHAVASLIVGFAIAIIAAVKYGPKASFTATPAGLPVPAWVLGVSTLILLLGLLRRNS